MAAFWRENTLRIPVGDDFITPDCAFELHTQDRRQFNFCVEVDCGTERIRSDKDTDSWQRKIRNYEKTQDQNYPKRFRVLVVTTRCSHRLETILDLAREHSKNPYRSLFFGIHLDRFLSDPDAVIRPCFSDHRRRPVSLVPLVPCPLASFSHVPHTGHTTMPRPAVPPSPVRSAYRPAVSPMPNADHDPVPVPVPGIPWSAPTEKPRGVQHDRPPSAACPAVGSRDAALPSGWTGERTVHVGLESICPSCSDNGPSREPRSGSVT